MAKIIFVNRFFYPDHSATSQLLADLAFNLADSHEVHVVTSRQRYDDPAARLPGAETVHGVRVWRVWSSRFGRGFLPARAFDYLTFYITAMKRLFALTRSSDVIIAKTDPPLISVVAAIVARIRGARLINWLQDLFPEIAKALRVPGAGVMSFLLLPARNWSLRVASANIVLGERMADVLRHLPAGHKLHVVVIHNWADGSVIAPVRHSDNPLRREWSLQGHFVIGYSGNMGRAHDLGAILEAAVRLRDDPRFLFLFIGSGALKTLLSDEVRQRHLGNVVFKPYQPRDQLALSLGASDVHVVSLKQSLEGYVVPSKYYGIAAAGRPVVNVGDANGEIAQIIARSRSGKTFAPDDAAALVSFLRELADNDAVWTNYAEQSRNSFDLLFTKKSALRLWRRVISDVLDGRHVDLTDVNDAHAGNRSKKSA